MMVSGMVGRTAGLCGWVTGSKGSAVTSVVDETGDDVMVVEDNVVVVEDNVVVVKLVVVELVDAGFVVVVA